MLEKNEVFDNAECFSLKEMTENNTLFSDFIITLTNTNYDQYSTKHSIFENKLF